jgi:uncharacterized membrane protein YcaP (DUF421 family)
MTFFESWSSLLRTLLSGVATYAAIVVLLRVSGKRTLAKLNAFDLVVTVAIGSTLASVMTSATLPLADGLLALALLVALQYLVAWLAVRVRWFRRILKSEPQLFFYEGRFLDAAMRRARLSHDELLAAARSSGQGDLASVRAIVLETDGSLSVLPAGEGTVESSALRDVRRAATGAHR